jgi:tetratricopeptide (TPR) repeat protein
LPRKEAIVSEATPSRDHFNNRAAIILAILAALVAVIAFLQSDAGARDDRANRDSKRYATEALGHKINGTARVNFDYNSAYQAWYELNLLATAATNREDEAAAKRYQTLRNQMAALSPLLAAPYFDPQTGNVDVAKYEAETYLTDITILGEKFNAASAVKDAWDAKANTYIVHLTLLAVALFMFGLATTISRPVARWIFVGVGLLTSVVAVVWAVSITLQPVPDLRERPGAIEAYARGVTLAYQNRYPEALTAFDEALTAAPDYTAAFAQRAETKSAMNDHENAVNDYAAARRSGDESASTAGDLAWSYYLLGRFEEANQLNREVLANKPDELWMRFNLALSLLAAGQIDAAKAEYQTGMDRSTQLVAEAKAAGQEPPYLLWWSLDMAANDLDDLTDIIDTRQGNPSPDKITNPIETRTATQELIAQLKSLSVGLEFAGKSPTGTITAKISPFQFGTGETDEQGNLTNVETAEEFPAGTQEVLVLFDYEGLRDGQEAIVKVYIDGEEDPSWRVIMPWEMGAAGSAQIPLSVAYSDTFVLSSGEYEVDLFVDGQLAQRGRFTVLAE